MCSSAVVAFWELQCDSDSGSYEISSNINKLKETIFAMLYSENKGHLKSSYCLVKSWCSRLKLMTTVVYAGVSLLQLQPNLNSVLNARHANSCFPLCTHALLQLLSHCSYCWESSAGSFRLCIFLLKVKDAIRANVIVLSILNEEQ